MKQDELRERLIDGTIQVIAREGLDKASTKLIGIETGVNEAYIYRCFKGKEDMFAKTFASLDNELVTAMTEHLPVMYDQNLDYNARCWTFFSGVWKFLLGNKDKCLTFMRYYYSPYFSKFSVQEHTKRYQPLMDTFKGAFLDEANVWMIFNHILTTMLDFAVKVFNGAVPNDEETAEHVFRLVYMSVQQYFKKKES